jgi:hypothetical protein
MTPESDIIAEALAAWRPVHGVLRPPPKLTISEWSDRHRVLRPEFADGRTVA